MKSILISMLFMCPMALSAEDESRKSPHSTNWKIDGVEAAQSIDELKKVIPFAREWKEFDWKGNRLLVGLSELPTSGESYIDIHGYIYNRSFKEWRRFCLVRTRNVGWAEVGLDEQEEELFLLAKANTPMKGKRVFRYSLLLLSDDRAYLPKAEQDGTGQPATRLESKSDDSQKPQPESDGRFR